MVRILPIGGPLFINTQPQTLTIGPELLRWHLACRSLIHWITAESYWATTRINAQTLLNK